MIDLLNKSLKALLNLLLKSEKKDVSIMEEYNTRNNQEVSMIDLATRIISEEEGFRNEVYLCSEGYPTVGLGLRIGLQDQSLDDFAGFPLMPEVVAEKWMESHIHEIIERMYNYPLMDSAFRYSNDVQKAVIISMCYQLGMVGAAKFKNTWNAVIKRDLVEAKVQMKDSLWYKQSPNRVSRQAEMMETGVILPYYGV